MSKPREQQGRECQEAAGAEHLGREMIGKDKAGGLWRFGLLLPGMLLLAACATTSGNRDVVVDRATSQGVAKVSADNVFDTADSDTDGHLMPVDIERLGLGGDWHTLDANGSGRISRQEFRDQFAAPLIQATLKLPGDADVAQPLVSSDFLLPPLPPTQRYVAAPIDAPAPATVTVPDDAPFNSPPVIPVLIDDQDAADINQAAERKGASESGVDDAEMPAN